MRSLNLVFIGCMWAVSACGSSADSAGALNGGFGDEGNGSGSGRPGGGGASPDDDGSDVEFERLQLSDPVVTPNHVFVANPVSGRVSRFLANSFSIRVTTTEVGNEPASLVAVPGTESVLVLNRGDDTLSRVTAVVGATVDDDVDTVVITAGANRIVVSPDGLWAAVWYDARVPRGERPVRTELGSLSEIELVALGGEDLSVSQLSTGVNIREVIFDDTTERLVLVTDEGLATRPYAALALDGFAVPRSMLDESEQGPLGFGQEFLYDAQSGLALLRVQGSQSIRVVDTVTGERATLTFETEPADIDLLPDGRLLATLRETEGSAGELALLEPTLILEGSGVEAERLPIPEHAVGQVEVSADGGRAVVFGTVSSLGASTELVSLLDVGTLERQVVNLRGTPLYVVMSADSPHAVVVHSTVTLPSADGGLPSTTGDPAVTLLDLAGGRSKLMLLAGDVTEVLFSSSGAFVWVATSGASAAERTLVRMDTGTFRSDTLPLGEVPLDLGWVRASGRVFVLQEHPYGRLTFVDELTLALRELTGFELAALIE
jgi:DNA-binding beta-propeller fold protein YncE